MFVGIKNSIVLAFHWATKSAREMRDFTPVTQKPYSKLDP